MNRYKDVEVIACAPAEAETPFSDNVKGECVRCKRPIIWRPYHPENIAKMCFFCAMAEDPEGMREAYEVSIRGLGTTFQ